MSQISNLTVVSSRHTVCVKNAAENTEEISISWKFLPSHYTEKNSKLLTSNCAFLILMKLPFDKSQNQTWFSNSRFTCEIQDNIVSRLHKNCHVKLSKENSVNIKFCKYNFIFLIKSKSNYCFIRNRTQKHEIMHLILSKMLKNDAMSSFTQGNWSIQKWLLTELLFSFLLSAQIRYSVHV